MEQGVIRRSSRPRGPPKDSFANEFIGDQWKQMRCDPKKPQNQRVKNGVSLEVNKSDEQIKLELACVMQQLDACRENFSCLSKRKSNFSSVTKSTDLDDALPIDFEIDCCKEQMFDCSKKIDALNTQLLRLGDLTADGACLGDFSECLQAEHVGVSAQPSKDESFPLDGLQTKRFKCPFDPTDSRFSKTEVLVACDSHSPDKAAHNNEIHAPPCANHPDEQVTIFPLLSVDEMTHQRQIGTVTQSPSTQGTLPIRGVHSIKLALDSSSMDVANAKDSALFIKDDLAGSTHIGGNGPYEENGVFVESRSQTPFINDELASSRPNHSRGPTDSSPCFIKKFTDLFKDNHVQNVSLENQSKGGEYAEDKSCISEDLKEFSLDFVPHGPRNDNLHLKIPSELIDEGKKEWQSTLVGHFVGKKKNPPFTIVSKTIERLWGNKGLIDTLGNSGFYFFTFSSVEEKDVVLEGGPWYIWGQPLILSPWKPNLKLNKEEVHAIPIWVNLFGIPLELWNRKGISFIASYLGKPLRMDRVTANRRRVSYARVCVEVSGAHDLITKFALETEDEMGGIVLTDITVEYQWTPLRCAKCSAFGHDCSRVVTPRPAPARRNSRRHPPLPSFPACSYNKKPKIGEWVVVKAKGKLVDSADAPRSEGNMYSVLSHDVEQSPSQSEVVVCPRGKDLGMASPSHHPSTGFVTGPEASSSPLDEGCEVSEYDSEEGTPVVKSIVSNRQMKREAKIKFSGSRPKGRCRN